MSTKPGGHDSRPLDGRHVIVLREIRGMTQNQLAKASRVSRATLSRIERGDKGLDRRVRDKLARGMGIPARAFEQIAAVVRHVDQEAGIDPAWTPEGPMERNGENAEDKTRVARRARHRRIAAAVAQSVEAQVFAMLEMGDEDTEDASD